VFNVAIDDEIPSFHPFRKFKIKQIETRKRALTIDKIIDLFTLEVEDWQVKYLDTFKLMFYLIGINMVDLCNLNKIQDERIEYYRAKTNRFYSIKVEPEALMIINKYRGKHYLLRFIENYKNYRDYTWKVNTNLHIMGENIGEKDITTYWARHTWATIASFLEIPHDTIAAALGHGGKTVTDIYIDYDQRKVDIANRKVIDFINEKIRIKLEEHNG